jgi:hypothetical protein
VIVTKRGTTSTPALVDGFEAGYVWDTKSAASTSTPNTRRPLKDGDCDHGQNCGEYVMLAFGPASGAKTTPPAPRPAPFFHRGPSEVDWMVLARDGNDTQHPALIGRHDLAYRDA